MVSTKFFLTIPKCSTCTAISPAEEEVILKKTLPYYARPHLKTYALKEEKCSFPSASFGAILSRLSKVIMDIFYFALLFCVIGPQILRHFFNQSDSKLNQSRFDHFCSPTPSIFCLFSWCAFVIPLGYFPPPLFVLWLAAKTLISVFFFDTQSKKFSQMSTYVRRGERERDCIGNPSS